MIRIIKVYPKVRRPTRKIHLYRELKPMATPTSDFALLANQALPPV